MISLLLALAAEPEKVCVQETITKKEICKGESHALGGAAIGWMIFGPIGAAVGAIAGAEPEKKCETVEEKVCTKYEIKK